MRGDEWIEAARDCIVKAAPAYCSRSRNSLSTLAAENGWTTLHLDTREGDISNDFYQSRGWIRAGIIPRWAQSANGSLDGTVFYYKLL